MDWNENLINESQITLDKWYTQFEKNNDDELNEDLLQPLLDASIYQVIYPNYIPFSTKLLKVIKIQNSFWLQANGLLEEDLESWKKFKKIKSKIDEKTIKSKIKDRENARKKGNYKLADNIRKDLENNDVIIEDKGDKTTWKYK